MFSNASSYRLDQSRHIHIGCICLTFLRCAFLNVSSNCLPEKRQSHTGCICLVFLLCEFSNAPSNCCVRRCKVTQVTLVWSLAIVGCSFWTFIVFTQVTIFLIFIHSNKLYQLKDMTSALLVSCLYWVLQIQIEFSYSTGRQM